MRTMVRKSVLTAHSENDEDFCKTVTLRRVKIPTISLAI